MKEVKFSIHKINLDSKSRLKQNTNCMYLFYSIHTYIYNSINIKDTINCLHFIGNALVERVKPNLTVIPHPSVAIQWVERHKIYGGVIKSGHRIIRMCWYVWVCVRSLRRKVRNANVHTSSRVCSSTHILYSNVNDST